MHIIIRYIYIYVLHLHLVFEFFFVHLSSFKLRMCLQCVMIPGIKGQYYQDMLLVLLELEN